ncbi:MAG: DUF262 domain-containing protein [Prevotella sp.]|nr:DUF262 domain-containing protein [Prevotella sp.]
MDKLILAITTIGDLLLRSKITKKEDGESIKDVRLIVPEYQRPYKWTARNAIQLLDDIIEAKNNNKEVYRVGTLILHRDKEVQDSVVYKIVDGQQRIITFSLLLYTLYELEKKKDRMKIDFLKQEVYTNRYNRHNIPNNLNAFKRRIIKRTDENDDSKDHIRDMKRLRDFIENQCELIVVITDDVSEAFQFFDSQNARGKALYPHDLLKAYHLREMTDVDDDKTESIVKDWERIPQNELADFFGDYLYRIKEWINGNWAVKLDEHNIYKFKGITKIAHTPYAQFYKGAYSYANMVNSSAMPFVAGLREINAFQLNTPIIAGKPFFDYTKHYYNILKDIQDNSKYVGFYINDNVIVKSLDKYFKKGVGNKITRLLFDTALLLYVDRFCPATYPTKTDVELFDQFVIYALIWAYSLRAQYIHLGWQSAQNYILEKSDKINAINIYKLISDSDTPMSLHSTLADSLIPLTYDDIYDSIYKDIEDEKVDDTDEKGIYKNYLHFFKTNNFYID